MPSTDLYILLAGLALALYGAWIALTSRARGSARLRSLLLLAAVVLAAVFHYRFAEVGPGGVLILRPPPLNLHEFYHYYIGTKYFDEVGHTRLYEATVLADWEDDRAHFVPTAVFRDLQVNRPDARRGDVPGRAAEIRGSFAPERWQAFKADIAIFRARQDRDYWHRAGFCTDHGYNGTPVTTAILGSIANLPWLPTLLSMRLAAWLDPLLILGVAGLLAGLRSIPTALGFLVLVFANPLNDHRFTGGAYLRYLDFAALAVGLMLLGQRAPRAAGAFVALAAGIRIFPALFTGVVVLQACLVHGFREGLRRVTPFVTSFAAVGVGLLVLSSILVAPPDRPAWLALVDNLERHAARPMINQVGLVAVLGYSPALSHSALATKTAQESIVWEDRTRALLRARRPIGVAAGLVVLAIVLASMRRLDPSLLVVPWLISVWVIAPLNHYYWMMLSLLPLTVSPTHRSNQVLGWTLAALLALAAAGPLASAEGLRFALFSVVVVAGLLGVLWFGTRRDSAGRGALAASQGKR